MQQIIVFQCFAPSELYFFVQVSRFELKFCQNWTLNQSREIPELLHGIVYPCASFFGGIYNIYYTKKD